MDDEDDDIFNMLLKEKNGNWKQTRNIDSSTNKSNSNLFEGGNKTSFTLPFDLSYSIDSTSQPSPDDCQLKLRILDNIYEQGLTVVDQCSDDQNLYILIDCSGLAIIHVYHLQVDVLNDFKPVTILQTMLKASLFQGFDNKYGKEIRCLYLIHQDNSECKERTSHVSPSLHDVSNLKLPTQSFSSIFGKSTALIKSSVILLCANDGCVYWRSVKTVGQEPKCFLMCQLHSVAQSILALPVKQSSCVDEDVSKVLLSALNSGDKTTSDILEGHSFGLLAVCEIGECCLVVPAPPLSCEWLPLRFCLPHPVVCCTRGRNQFIYSTGWSVEAANLCLKTKENQPSVCLNNCVRLKTMKAIHLFTAILHKAEQLFALTTDLDSVMIPWPSTMCTATNVIPTDSNFLSDTLQSMKQHASSFKSFQSKSTSLDSLLTQLNVFANLYHREKNERITSVTNAATTTQMDLKNTIINCQCFFDHSKCYYKESELRVVLRNDTTITLSKQWSVLVTVVPEKCDLKSELETQSYTFPLHEGLHPGSKLTFSMSLPEHLISNHFINLRVFVLLVLCVRKKDFEALTFFHEGNENILMEIEIFQQLYDCLYFLSLSSDDEWISSVNKKSIDFQAKQLLDNLMEWKRSKKEENITVACGSKNDGEFVTSLCIQGINEQDTNLLEKESEVMKILFTNLRNFPSCDNPCVFLSPNRTKISFILESTKPSNTKKSGIRIMLKSCNFVLLYTVHSSLLERFKAARKNGLTMANKDDLEDKLVSLKKIVLSLTSTSKEQENLCCAMDGLGACLL